jgi:hypothetical protein
MQLETIPIAQRNGQGPGSSSGTRPPIEYSEPPHGIGGVTSTVGVRNLDFGSDRLWVGWPVNVKQLWEYAYGLNMTYSLMAVGAS